MIRARDLSFGRRMLAMASGFLLCAGGQGALAQTPELRNLNNQFKTEAGCPVQVVSAKTDLEIDPIGTPMACRIYIDYKNTSAKTVSGVKFRIGYIDADEKIRGSFHAPDGHVLEPGGVAKAKWRGEKIDPRTAHVLIRVLVARFSDGTTWVSEKMKDLAPGTGGAGAPASGSGGGDSAAAPALSGGAQAANAASGSGAGDSAAAAEHVRSSSVAPADAGTNPAMSAGGGVPAAAPAGSDKSSDGY